MHAPLPDSQVKNESNRGKWTEKISNFFIERVFPIRCHYILSLSFCFVMKFSFSLRFFALSEIRYYIIRAQLRLDKMFGRTYLKSLIPVNWITMTLIVP